MQTPTIRGTTRADLIALPAVMLGFHPWESCVVLALDGTSVRFCVRLDNDWFVADFDAIASQILQASGNAGATSYVLIGFGDPDLACAAILELIDVLGVSTVVEALVADGYRYWSVLDPGEPVGYSFETSSVAAQAVFQGLNVSHDRETALLPVTSSSPPTPSHIAVEEATVAGLTSTEAMESLARLAEADALSQPEALRLAVLVADEDRFTALLARMKTWTAERYWERLIEVRCVCPRKYEPNVLALLALASWLCGKGAAHTSCLEQLARRAAGHPMLSLLHRVHRDGVPPRRWDE